MMMLSALSRPFTKAAKISSFQFPISTISTPSAPTHCGKTPIFVPKTPFKKLAGNALGYIFEFY